MIDVVLGALFAGFYALVEYLSAHVLTCLIPAFFIAGAMSALLPKEKITKYLGKNVPKYKAYPLSIAAGLLLAVCSCTILPLFAGIRKKGAGIGPAIAFLYTAPATNILAIIFTGSVLGWELAASRILLSVTFAIVIGVAISFIFKEKAEPKAPAEREAGKRVRTSIFNMILHDKLAAFFFALIAILMIGASKIDVFLKAASLIALIAFLFVQLKLRFKREEITNWLKETWNFFKVIFPLLLTGIFVAGVLTSLIPENFLATYVGNNSVFANLIAVLFGVFMYFPTLVEVPMAKMFLGLGMAAGPLLAYLLADPVISLPSMLVVRKIMGTKRTLAYAFLIIIFCTISGLIYGALAG
jgi:uncharacterized membrane protein YraQ (UPF0718 family)